MKLTPRFYIRAGLVLCAAGALGAFGACKETTKPPPSEPPPPPGAPAAPVNVTATVKSTTQIDVSWTDASANEDGFKIESCSGASCTNFAEIGSVAANATTFSNTGLTANTEYSYRVKAFNSVGSNMSSVASGKTGQPPAKVPEAIMVGAGEITSCRAGLSGQTAVLVDKVIADNASTNVTVFTTGSNVSDTTTGCSYPTAWENSGWAKFKDRMRVALTQRDYTVGTGLTGTVKTPTPGWIYSTFGDKAGEQGKGWYSFDIGQSWHVVVLNSGTWEGGTANLTDPSSPQNTWLAADLAATQRPCVMAIFGHRRFYSAGNVGGGLNSNALQVWASLYRAKVDLVVSGWDKYYERYALQDHHGTATPDGVRQFIVGTGGRSLDNLPPVENKFPTAEVRDASTQGVLKLTLFNDSYSWEFIPLNTGGFTDTGTTACH